MSRDNRQGVVSRYELWAFCILLSFLLFYGGHRLVDVEGREMGTTIPLNHIHCILQNVEPPLNRNIEKRFVFESFGEHSGNTVQVVSPSEVTLAILSDANGNVLNGNRTYLHIVYQLFSLGDGFT